MKNLLIENNIKFTCEKKFEWLKYNGKLRLDFYLTDYNVAIECQGVQHFEPTYFGGRNKNMNNMYQDLLRRDNIKYELCKEHGIRIIYYTNVERTETKNMCKNTEDLLKLINDECSN